MTEVTDNTKTLANALARIEALEVENRHLLKVIKERKLAGFITETENGKILFKRKIINLPTFRPVYYISDEFDAAGFLITPEVKIEQ